MAKVDGLEIDWNAAVPFALDEEDRRVHPKLCKRPWANHYCPFCDGDVSHVERSRAHKSSDPSKRTLFSQSRYFRHVRETCHEPMSDYEDWRRPRGDAGGGESERHAQIKRQIHEWLDLEGSLELHYYCMGCHSARIERCPLPDFSEVVEEHDLPCGRRVDLALLDEEGVPVLAIEVAVTHALERDKRADLEVPWIEVDHFDVRGDRVLHVRTCDTPRYCSKCAEDFEHGMSWWREFAYGPELEAYLESEAPRRLTYLAPTKMTPRLVQRIGAETCQAFENQLEPEERQSRAHTLAAELGVDMPSSGTPWVWYCRSCSARMLVVYWPKRERGHDPPESLSKLVVKDTGNWQEVCPCCEARQNIHWHWSGPAAE